MDLEGLFMLKFSGMEEVIKYCMDIGLISKEVNCRICDAPMKLIKTAELKDEHQWLCNRKVGNVSHSIKKSVRTGSIFAGSKTSIIDALLVMFMWCDRFRPRQMQKHGKISSSALTDWLSTFREICVEICLSRRSTEPIGGKGCIVELDECTFGVRRFKRGRAVKGNYVIAAVDKSSHKCLYEVMPQKSKAGLLKVIKEKILPGTTIISTCWENYNCLQEEEFKELATSSSIKFENSFANARLGSWGQLKKLFGGAHCAKDQEDIFLAEYICRNVLGATYFFDEFLTEVVKVYQGEEGS